jgi:hypothetical protein
MDNSWSEEEKKKYLLIRRKELGSFYAEQGISIDQPEIREMYLMEKVLMSNDYKDIDEFSQIHGKAEALEKLENIIFERFF